MLNSIFQRTNPKLSGYYVNGYSHHGPGSLSFPESALSFKCTEEARSIDKLDLSRHRRAHAHSHHYTGGRRSVGTWVRSGIDVK